MAGAVALQAAIRITLAKPCQQPVKFSACLLPQLWSGCAQGRRGNGTTPGQHLLADGKTNAGLMFIAQQWQMRVEDVSRRIWIGWR